MVQHMSQTDGGGGCCSIMEKFFLVTINGQGPAHSAPIVVIW